MSIMKQFLNVLTYIEAFLILILIVLFAYVSITDSPMSAMNAVLDPFRGFIEAFRV